MKVSCICPTWNRPNWLEECIQSFLIQDYRGDKELIVLNDNPEQELLYDHPDVKVINVKEKYKSLGQKYNDMFFKMASGDVITPWEDDDIFLPHKISHGLRMMDKFGADYYKLGRAYYWNDGKITYDHKTHDGISNNLFWCAAFYTIDVLKRMGGCSSIANAAADQSIENFVQAYAVKNIPGGPVLPRYKIDDSKNASDVYYIYRWGGIGTHISGIPESPENMAKFQELNAANMRRGVINLRPHWKTDYVELCAKFRRDNNI
jgi:glycosyltransferase involved in cell wall biosynthesis